MATILFYKGSRLNIRYFYEHNQGLSYARNRAYKEGRGKYIAYIDDDAMLDSNWSKLALEIIHKKQPDVFGGPIYPYYLSKKPTWFKDEYEIRIHSDKSGWLSKDKEISGSNMTFKKSLLHELGGFPTELGMNGYKLQYGEETLLLLNCHKMDKSIYYSHDLIVNHLVPDFKMTPTYQSFWMFNQGKSAYHLRKALGKDTMECENREDELKQLYSYIKNLHENINGFLIKDKSNSIETDEYLDELKKINRSFYPLGLKLAAYQDRQSQNEA